MNNEALMIIIFALVYLVILVATNIYIWKSCSVTVKAKVIGIPDTVGPYTASLFVVEYVYKNVVYRRSTPLHIKDLQVDQIIDININPKDPKKLIHKSCDKPFMKLLLVVALAIICAIYKMIKEG